MKSRLSSVALAMSMAILFGSTCLVDGLADENPTISPGDSKSVAAIASIRAALDHRLLDPEIPLHEVQAEIVSRIPSIPPIRSVEKWNQYVQRVRNDVLERVVFRGEAARWRMIPTRVEWLGSIDGGPGYRIRKLRYEAVPGLWIPALLYEPTHFSREKVPVSLALNGHDPAGKAVDYKQLRCINQAKRGVLVLNTEYLGMGQLKGPSYDHYRMNQLDLCGTSGLAPFYLVMSRGLDILLSHEHADPARVAVSGLSGGGWQTITIAAFDPRVTLCNPVAGYSSLRTHVCNFTDLGDSEQSPTDLETVVDYAQMTAMLAPRPALLTYNLADNCCFKADHALPPLVSAAEPVYELFGKPQNLRTHVNDNPGTHNFGLDNREQFYALLKDFFFADRSDIPYKEIESQHEVKTPEELAVPLPKGNADFNSLARQLMAPLPRESVVPSTPETAARWQLGRRGELKNIVRAKALRADPIRVREDKVGPYVESDWWLRVGGWTVPAIELAPPEPKGEVILIADGGRKSAAEEIGVLLTAGMRVLAADLFYFGESKISQRDHLFALALSSVGQRPLGIQSSQLAAIARFIEARNRQPPQITAIGPRSSLIALVAAALEPKAISGLELRGGFGSLKEIIQRNMSAEQAPELFCFGLLERFDVLQLRALIDPRPVHSTP
jgi:hypothetical protein